MAKVDPSRMTGEAIRQAFRSGVFDLHRFLEEFNGDYSDEDLELLNDEKSFKRAQDFILADAEPEMLSWLWGESEGCSEADAYEICKWSEDDFAEARGDAIALVKRYTQGVVADVLVYRKSFEADGDTIENLYDEILEDFFRNMLEVMNSNVQELEFEYDWEMSLDFVQTMAGYLEEKTQKAKYSALRQFLIDYTLDIESILGSESNVFDEEYWAAGMTEQNRDVKCAERLKKLFEFDELNEDSSEIIEDVKEKAHEFGKKMVKEYQLPSDCFAMLAAIAFASL